MHCSIGRAYRPGPTACLDPGEVRSIAWNNRMVGGAIWRGSVALRSPQGEARLTGLEGAEDDLVRLLYPQRMQTRPGSFSWSEDLDESLNFWFWLRRTEGIDDARLLERLNQWAEQDSFSAQKRDEASFEHHLKVRDHERWREYLPIWQAWKKTQAEKHVEDIHAQKPGHARTHYKSMAALGVRLRVQWVMAPFGERWLLPPDLAVMGVEGATAQSRPQAVLEAARALASFSAAG